MYTVEIFTFLVFRTFATISSVDIGAFIFASISTITSITVPGL